MRSCLTHPLTGVLLLHAAVGFLFWGLAFGLAWANWTALASFTLGLIVCWHSFPEASVYRRDE